MEGWDGQWVWLQGTWAERVLGPALTLGRSFLLSAWTPYGNPADFPQGWDTASMYGAFVQIKRCSAQQARQKKDSRSSGHGLEEKCGLDELPLMPAWPGGLVQDTA